MLQPRRRGMIFQFYKIFKFMAQTLHIILKFINSWSWMLCSKLALLRFKALLWLWLGCQKLTYLNDFAQSFALTLLWGRMD